MGKAAGLDDWVGEELRLWPPPMLQARAALLRKVEELGILARWPLRG